MSMGINIPKTIMIDDEGQDDEDDDDGEKDDDDYYDDQDEEDEDDEETLKIQRHRQGGATLPAEPGSGIGPSSTLAALAVYRYRIASSIVGAITSLLLSGAMTSKCYLKLGLHLRFTWRAINGLGNAQPSPFRALLYVLQFWKEETEGDSGTRGRARKRESC